MALRKIVKKGDPILGKKSREVEEVDDKVRELIDDMVETMRDAEGVGLAAPQVGILKRIVVIEYDGKLYELVNPRIVAKFGTQHEAEACLSVPGLAGVCKRPSRVKVEALDRNGKKVKYSGTGMLAIAFCHEIDHLDGILYTDIAYDVYKV